MAGWALAVLLAAPGAADAQAPPDPLTMEWAVAATLRAHPALDGASARVRAAAAVPDQSWVLPDPMLMVEGFPVYMFGHGFHTVMFSLRQDVPLGGSRRLAAGAAQRDVRAARADARVTALDLALVARLSYLGFAEAQETRARREQDLALARATADVVRARVTTGAASASSVLDAMFVVTEGEAALEASRGEEEAARVALAVLVGLPPDAPLPRALPLSLPPEPPPVAVLVERAIRARPELSALEARRAAAALRADSARARWAPMLTFEAGYMLDFMAPDGLVATAGISLPIFAGPRSAAAREATSAAAALRADAATRERTSTSEIASTRAALVATRARATIIRDRLVPQAHAHHDLALTEFARGQTDLFGVLSALRHHISSRVEEVAATARAQRLQAVLERVMGSPPGTDSTRGE
jgi:outer membrane protein TolC